MRQVHRHRWFQFSLRQLLSLMALVAIASPWLPAAYCRLFPPESAPCPVCGYGHESVEYFAPGPEFKLSREAAAQKSAEAQPDPAEPVIADPTIR
jgi:hypothetical protein